MSRSVTFILLSLGASLLFGCATTYIGNTRIEDTSRNREILKVVEQYRRAMEDRDAQRILSLVSDRFFEDPGTPGNPSDDYDKAGLAKKLERTFANVEDLHLRIDSRKIVPMDGGDEMALEYRYTLRFKPALQSASNWDEKTDLNRIVLVKEEEEWKILSGL